MTASTLQLGGVTPTDANLPAFVFAEPEVGDDDVLVARIGEWIAHRGPSSNATDGHDDAVKTIWELARDSELVQGEIDKLKETYDQDCVKLERVKTLQSGKFNSITDPKVLDVKTKELNDWFTNKKALCYKPVAMKQAALTDLKVRYDASVLGLLKSLKCGSEQQTDPEVEELMKELSTMFGDMGVDSNTEDAPEMTASSLALSRVQDLPDGPEKAAMFAVLQASVPSSEAIREKP